MDTAIKKLIAQIDAVRLRSIPGTKLLPIEDVLFAELLKAEAYHQHNAYRDLSKRNVENITVAVSGIDVVVFRQSEEHKLSYDKREAARQWDREVNFREYLYKHDRSKYILRHLSKFTQAGSSVLDIGCGPGRDLAFLSAHGYGPLYGIDVSRSAVALALENCNRDVCFMRCGLDSILPKFANEAFDVVLAVAALEHVHTDDETVFGHIERICRNTILIISDDTTKGELWYPRNLEKIFTERKQFKLIYKEECPNESGFDAKYTTGVYARIS